MHFTGRDRFVSLIENRGILVTFIFSCCVFFVWMDMTLFQCILEMPPVFQDPNTTKVVAYHSSISPFADLSVKVMMMDPVNHYFHTFLAQVFNKVTNFSSTFHFVSPHFISFCGVLFAFAATKCILSDNLAMHFSAVVLLQVRCWFDALDGIVARARINLVKNISMKWTPGYVVDGVADTVGYTAFLLGAYFYLKRSVPKHRPPSKDVEKDGRPVVLWTSAKIFKVCFMFGLQTIISSILWNRYIEKYYLALESPATTQRYAISQNEMLKSPVTLLVIWIWRLCGAHGLMQIYMVAVLLHKKWEFHLFVQYIGFFVLFVAFVISEANLHHVKNFLASIPVTGSS